MKYWNARVNSLESLMLPECIHVKDWSKKGQDIFIKGDFLKALLPGCQSCSYAVDKAQKKMTENPTSGRLLQLRLKKRNVNIAMVKIEAKY